MVYHPKTKYFLLAILIMLFLAVIFVDRNINKLKLLRRTTTVNTFAKTKVNSTFTLTLTPTPTVTFTPTPSPTPALVGFCLRVPVLLYHHIKPLDEAKKANQTNLDVTPDAFEKQISYLNASGYTTITAEKLGQALVDHQNLPGKNIVLTLDDGYDDVYNYAFPLAQKYHVILNLMIPSGLIGNSGYLTWEQLRKMKDSGLVYFYDHTWSHASLGNLSEDKMQFEVMTAKKQLEEQLGIKINIFTYPYGSESNNVIKFLSKNGFIAAYSTIGGFFQCDSFIMSLHRNRIGNTGLSYYGL